ncbi:HNH endonuclease [Microbacterium sp. UCD-TDU]|uniref:HNH endonuclease n=1 Tax=Microbacterium sp. UCD-TDU TaxID=1247714 RepID=UPI00163F7158|nr:HNH endonuclease [Microbacterium sp. UCD-TDU]
MKDVAGMNLPVIATKKPYSRAKAGRSIPGFAGLRADANGWIYTKRDGQRLKSRVVGGVLCVDVSKPTQRQSPWVPVAILVARAFVPIPRPRYRHREVIHLDGDRKNCRASNLAWVRGPRRRQTPILPRQSS